MNNNQTPELIIENYEKLHEDWKKLYEEILSHYYMELDKYNTLKVKWQRINNDLEVIHQKYLSLIGEKSG